MHDFKHMLYVYEQMNEWKQTLVSVMLLRGAALERQVNQHECLHTLKVSHEGIRRQ